MFSTIPEKPSLQLSDLPSLCHTMVIYFNKNPLLHGNANCVFVQNIKDLFTYLSALLT